ncbi:MAG TPA: amidohydrolase, partial [Desulfomicrobiaceae bacterium]|nr:amidohydrolase [Desulfomicrobiaceae bacterium]
TATRGSAEIYGQECGRLAVGAPADCILVRLDDTCMTPVHNVVSNWVYSGGRVLYTICAGRILMRNGVVDGEDEILREARRCAARLCEKAQCTP